MKTKLLKKVRKRYEILKVKVEPWMSEGDSIFQVYYCCKNEDGYCFVLCDNHNRRFDEYCKSYSKAISHLKKWIIYDYKDTSKKRRNGTKIEKLWYS